LFPVEIKGKEGWVDGVEWGVGDDVSRSRHLASIARKRSGGIKGKLDE
jgi:hypothetical protein